jgi:hypothetical protein
MALIVTRSGSGMGTALEDVRQECRTYDPTIV